MPSSRDLYIDWNGDLVLTAQGSLLLAQGWDLVRQRITRNLITNSAQLLPDGSTTVPDYVYHPSYGIGLGALVGQNPDAQYQQTIVGKITAAVQSDIDAMPGSAPVVKFAKPQPGTFVTNVSVQLSNGATGKISVAVS